MQTASYSVSSGNRIELWRGIPAEIEISGIEDTSGDWLFLIGENWRDGSLLSGTVAASGEKLIVTLEEMNTVELAKAISSHDSLLCRATLTDKTSRVYIIPVTILNRAVDGVPTPVSKYYTKAEIDEIIAGLQPGDGVATVNGDPGPDVVLDANAVHALSAFGVDMRDLDIDEMEGTVISLSPAKVFVHTLTAGEIFTFDTSGLTASLQVTGEVHLIQPSTAVSFTLPPGILWEEGGAFAAGNDAPDFSTGSTLYALVFRWDGTSILGNLAYTKAV